MRNIKKKIYHKLINNKLSYNSKSITRYKKNTNNITNDAVTDKLSRLEKLKKQINSIKNCDLKVQLI